MRMRWKDEEEVENERMSLGRGKRNEIDWEENDCKGREEYQEGKIDLKERKMVEEEEGEENRRRVQYKI